jgi:hypothetical protein
MSSAKVVDWKDVEAMLNTCAPGWTRKLKKHRLWIIWKKEICTILPLGEHGKRKKGNYEIEVGKVKNLVWTLGIDHRCAAESLGIPIPERP